MSGNYELENRILDFAISVRKFFFEKNLSFVIRIDAKQVIRSSGSIGANYIEANAATSPKDKIYRMKVARKEAKETTYWLKICEFYFKEMEQKKIGNLKNESEQIVKILSSIIKKLDY